MTSRMDTVSIAKRPNTGTKNATPTLVVTLRPRRITMPHSTSDSSETQGAAKLTMGQTIKQITEQKRNE